MMTAPPPRGGLHFDRRRRKLLGSPRADAHAASFSHERPGARQPQAAARSRDDGDFVRELQIHLFGPAAGEIVQAPVDRLIGHLECVPLQEFLFEWQ